MRDQLLVLDYADPRRKRLLPTRNDWGVAVFIIIAVIAAMIGVVGVVTVVYEYLTAPRTLSFLLMGLFLYGGSIALAWGAVQLAKRRARIR